MSVCLLVPKPINPQLTHFNGNVTLFAIYNMYVSVRCILCFKLASLPALLILLIV